MKLFYKPFGIVFGIFAGFVSKKIFEAVWGIFDNEEPPKPTTQETTWPKVIGAAAVEGVAFKVTRAAVDRVGTLAGLRLDELGDDSEPFDFGEPGDRRALRLDPETRALLLPCRDTIVANCSVHTKGIPPFALCMEPLSEQ